MPPVTITAGEFKEYSDQVSDDWYFDGDVEIPDSFIEGTADPDDILEIDEEDVCVVYQGKDKKLKGTILDMSKEIAKWRKKKTEATLVITVKKDLAQQVKKFVKSIGGEVK